MPRVRCGCWRGCAPRAPSRSTASCGGWCARCMQPARRTASGAAGAPGGARHARRPLWPRVSAHGNAWDEMALLCVELCGQRTLPVPRSAALAASSACMSEPIGHLWRHLRPHPLWPSAHCFRAVAVCCASAQVRFLPTGDPPHRDVLAGATRRCGSRWCSAAIVGQSPPSLPTIARCAARGHVVFTVDTLLDLRREYPERSLCLYCSGMDAFLGMPHWHRWREIFELAHVVVAHRPGLEGADHRPPGRGDGRSWHRQRA